MSDADRLDLMRAIADLAAEPAPGSPRTPAQADEATDDAERRAIADQAARTKAAIDRQAEAETRALDAFGLAAILEAVTPADDVSLATWRAEMDAKLVRADDELAALRAEADAEIRRTEARLAQHNRLERDDTNDEMEEDVEEDRTPLARATKLMDQRLTAIRRYVYSKLRLPYVGYSAPAIITAVDTAAQFATVRLQDGSGATVDGVEYGSGNPVVGAPTTLNLPVKVPPDPRRPLVQPVPAGRAWITVPRGARWLYYTYASRLWRVPWPLDDPDAEPEERRNVIGATGIGIQSEDFLGIDGLGWAWFRLQDFEHQPRPGVPVPVYLVAWEASGTGDQHGPYAVPTNVIPVTVDATPGAQGLLAFHEYIHETWTTLVEFQLSADGQAWSTIVGPLTEIVVEPHPPNQLQFGVTRDWELWTPAYSYHLWTDSHGARRALWPLQRHPPAPPFWLVDIAGGTTALDGGEALWWAGPGDADSTAAAILVTNGGLVRTPGTPGGLFTSVSAPWPFTGNDLAAAQDWSMTNLLAVDFVPPAFLGGPVGTWWYSQDSGATWTRAAWDHAVAFLGGGSKRFGCIVDTAEVAA